MTAVSCQPHAAIGDPLMFWVLVLVQAITGLTVSLVLKYCDSLVKGFSTSVSVLLAMLASAVLFDFQLTRPFAIGSAVVCCAFYLYFGAFNARLLREDEANAEKESLLATVAPAGVASDGEAEHDRASGPGGGGELSPEKK